MNFKTDNLETPSKPTHSQAHWQVAYVSAQDKPAKELASQPSDRRTPCC